MTDDGPNAYTYDFDNRLLTADTPGDDATMKYDPLGRLYEIAITGGATTRFLYDGANVIAEYNGSNSLLRRYVHGPGADEPAVWLEGTGTSNKRWLHADARGSIIALTDDDGDADIDDDAGTPDCLAPI